MVAHCNPTNLISGGEHHDAYDVEAVCSSINPANNYVQRFLFVLYNYA